MRYELELGNCIILIHLFVWGWQKLVWFSPVSWDVSCRVYNKRRSPSERSVCTSIVSLGVTQCLVRNILLPSFSSPHLFISLSLPVLQPAQLAYCVGCHYEKYLFFYFLVILGVSDKIYESQIFETHIFEKLFDRYNEMLLIFWS